METYNLLEVSEISANTEFALLICLMQTPSGYLVSINEPIYLDENATSLYARAFYSKEKAEIFFKSIVFQLSHIIYA